MRRILLQPRRARSCACCTCGCYYSSPAPALESCRILLATRTFGALKGYVTSSTRGLSNDLSSVASPRSATPARSTAVIRKADAAILERGRLSTINNYSSLHNVAQNSNLSDSCIALQEQHAARAHHAPRRAAAHETTTTQSTITLAAPPRAIETRPERVERVEAIYRMGRRGLNRTRAGRGDARGHHAETPRLRI